VVLALLASALTVSPPQRLLAQPLPSVGPPLSEVQATWKGFWTAVILGDLAGARKYVHSHRQHLFPGNKTLAELQELARQMAECRIDPAPFPVSLDEVIYRVHCQRGIETAETQVGLRRDLDGVWRFSVL
jgi:hypothetical protein